MQIIPAIDLLGGKVVRLTKGDMDAVTVYSDNPADMAKQFQDLGMKRLHVVDLDGAKKGDTINFPAIEKIMKETSMQVEVGGGIRDMERLKKYFNIGVTFGILGTVVVKNPMFVLDALAHFPGRIVLGVDARNGMVATEGWYEDSGLSAIDVIRQFNGLQAESVIYTDIERDGMLGGINLPQTDALAKESPFPVIASGGVASIDDIRKIIETGNKNISGCIVGKAYYEGKIDLRKAALLAGM